MATTKKKQPRTGTTTKATASKKQTKPKLSALDGAAKVLATAKDPMSTKELIATNGETQALEVAGR